MSTLNLIILQCSTIGDGYRLAQAGAEVGLEILELAITAAGSLVIFNSDSRDLEIKWDQIESRFHGRMPRPQYEHLIKELPVEIFECYLSQKSSELQSEVVVIESESIGNVLSFLKEKFENTADKNFIFDLRFIRGTKPVAYAILNSWTDHDEIIHKKYNLRAAVIKNAHQAFKNSIC